MEISKVSSISFKGHKTTTPELDVKPNKPQHKNRSALVVMGLVAAGAVAAAVLVKKKKITLPNFTKKLNAINSGNPKSQQKVAQKAAKTPIVQPKQPKKIIEVPQGGSLKCKQHHQRHLKQLLLLLNNQ